MGATATPVAGTLTADGVIRLLHRPEVAPGPVRVWLESVPAGTPSGQQTMRQIAQHIRADMRARGEVGRTREEIDADIAAMRAEANARLVSAERLQDDLARQRDGG